MDDEAILEQLTTLYENQKKLADSATQRKGKKPLTKALRADLALQFRHEATLKVPPGYATGMVRQTVIGYAYPPCLIPLAQLEPITIDELELETVHRGRVLLVRTFGYPLRIQAVQNAIEDCSGAVDRLAIYNFESELRPEQLLPKGQVVAIKEPYYKATADGGCTVRVDHPSDLVKLRPEDDIVPLELRPRSLKIADDATQWKNKGNAAFKAKDYRSSVDFYSKGLESCTDDGREDSLRRVLHRNRAQANIFLGRYETALADAEASVVPSDTLLSGQADVVESNAKAFYRAGMAAYHIQDFGKAKEKFEAFLKIAPTDGNGQQQLRRTEERIVEQTSGKFNFDAMTDYAMMTNKRLDTASFTANVEIQKTPDRGHGLFTTKPIKAGELVLVEKALCVAFSSDKGGDQSVIMNLNTSIMSVGTHPTRLVGVVQKLLHSPKLAEKFMRLYDGGYESRGVNIVDGLVAVDTFQVEAALDFNGFGCPSMPTSVDRDMADQATSSTGVWLNSSFINHDCIGNAARSFIGDMMVIRATKDLEKGDEILMRYKNSEADIESFQKNMQQSWKFRCTCALCTADTKTPVLLRKRRIDLIKEAESFLQAYQITENTPPTGGLITKAEWLRSKLEATYGKSFEHLPRQALLDLNLWICMAQTFGTHSRVQKAATTLLRDLGFVVSVKKNKVSIDRTHCMMDMGGIHAGMYLASSYYHQGQKEVGNELKRFTREMYETIHGSMLGFEEKFGVSQR